MPQILPTPFRFITLYFSLLCLAAVGGVRAQGPSEPPPTRVAGLDQLSEAELLKSYLDLQDQLHAAQLAIANNRIEAEVAARAQASALAEKLDAIRAAMATERDRQQAEAQRTAAERDRQQIETQRQEAERDRQLAETQNSIHTIFWIAAMLGGAGFLAMAFTTFYQWRTIRRLPQLTAKYAQQLGPSSRSDLPLAEAGTLTGDSVSNSNQRLMATIDRMERRILELEHTTNQSPPAASVAHLAQPLPILPGSAHGNSPSTTTQHASNQNAVDSPRRAASDNAAWFGVWLENGRLLLSTNRIKEAIACFDEILKIEPNHTDALVKKGAALERLKQDVEAIKCYDRAIAADEKMTLAYLHKASAYNRMQRYEDALVCYEHAMRVEEGRKQTSRSTLGMAQDGPIRLSRTTD